jgi:hypothetical protein
MLALYNSQKHIFLFWDQTGKTRSMSSYHYGRIEEGLQ